MNYYLSPMMGYTDCYFRSLVENIYGNSVTTFSEMIVDKAIIHNETKTITKHFLKNNKSAIQIAGSDPEEIKRAINILNKVDIIKHVNFNLGCPSSRVQENMLGLALTQKYDLVKKCLYELIKYNKDVSVKCRLGLGMNEDKSYIFDYLKLFNEIGIKKVFIHCRNGVLNLDTKKNRTIPKINYNLFLECCDQFPEMELIPNGEVNDLERRVQDKRNETETQKNRKAKLDGQLKARKESCENSARVVKSKNIDQKNEELVLELVAIDYMKNQNDYEINLIFKNNAHIALTTETIEVRLEDQNEIK